MKKRKASFFKHPGQSASRLLLMVAICLLATLQVMAQTRVTGRVTDEGQRPLSGVSVIVKGTNNGTTTDANGNFTISVPGANNTLVFSYVGYGTIEQQVGSNTTINLSLSPSSTTGNLNEVVVIGYGTATKRDLTGSITKVSGKEVQDRPNTNPIASLQGKVAGLSVVNSGTPGQEPDIRIRGTVSIGAVKPLYVVDGIFQDNIDFINPNDIESIEILKDPSSLAIFGIRGATGVIAITTK
ncbi:MAG TPA: carboxypeptidase-like regulatory domain-containing protein, partial [Flavisolibacter sp.]